MSTEMQKIKAIKAKYLAKLFKMANVVSVGIGFKKYESTGEIFLDRIVIVVGVSQKIRLIDLDPKDIIPYNLDGIQTDVVQVGEIRALQTPDPKTKLRPAPGGCSIGNVLVTAGTMTCKVLRDDEALILSNAHILVPDPTLSETDETNIVQPGTYDGGTEPEDHIGSLIDYVTVEPIVAESECTLSRATAWLLNGISSLLRRQTRFLPMAVDLRMNIVDAALCKPENADDVGPEVIGIGVPIGSVPAVLGMQVTKSGRTTGLTKGVVTQVDVTTSVGYGGGKMAMFTDQIIITGDDEVPFSRGGDSGSGVFYALADGPAICGLLFAGNDQENVTIANQFLRVEEALNIHIHEKENEVNNQ